MFDALISERPYKKAWPEADAVAYLQREAGRHFDPWLVELFVQRLPEMRQIRELYADVPEAAPVADPAALET